MRRKCGGAPRPRSLTAQQKGSWGELYKRYRREVEEYFTARVPCPHDVEDLVQDVFTSLVVRARIPMDPHVYVYVVSRNRLRLYRRKCKDELPNFSGQQPDRRLVRAALDASSDPLEQVLMAEMRGLLDKAMAMMSPKYFEAITLRFLKGMSLRETADNMNCSKETCKKRLQRAKQHLQQSCGEVPAFVLG